MSRFYPSLIKLCIPIVLIMLLLTVFGERGLIRAHRMAVERDEIREKVAKLRRENGYLKKELAALRGDKRYIEDIARRELGYVRPGETVYRFRE